MKRIQLFLDERLLAALRSRARCEKTTVSELVRKSLRKNYTEIDQERYAAMMGIVGLWKDRADLPGTETYVRSLRKGDRLRRLGIR